MDELQRSVFRPFSGILEIPDIKFDIMVSFLKIFADMAKFMIKATFGVVAFLVCLLLGSMPD